MKHLSKTLALALVFIPFASAAQAADTSECQIVSMETLDVNGANGEAQMVSLFPATEFIASVRDGTADHISGLNGQRIQALMCTRNDVIPTEADYGVLATGVPLSLSQNFEGFETDSLTVKWIEDRFKYKYEGYPLSEEALATLRARLATFSERGLNASAVDFMAAEAKEAARLKDIQKTDLGNNDAPIPSFEDNAASEVINTVRTHSVSDVAEDDFDARDAEVIAAGNAYSSEATKLNVQTKN